MMKRVIVMGTVTALFIMLLGACGNTGGTKQGREEQDMSTNSDKTESGEDDTQKKAMIGFYTVDTAISIRMKQWRLQIT